VFYKHQHNCHTCIQMFSSTEHKRISKAVILGSNQYKSASKKTSFLAHIINLHRTNPTHRRGQFQAPAPPLPSELLAVRTLHGVLLKHSTFSSTVHHGPRMGAILPTAPQHHRQAARRNLPALQSQIFSSSLPPKPKLYLCPFHPRPGFTARRVGSPPKSVTGPHPVEPTAELQY